MNFPKKSLKLARGGGKKRRAREEEGEVVEREEWGEEGRNNI